MSRVTIDNLFIDSMKDAEGYDKIKNIEIVPRKIVEIIIAECNSQISDFHHNPSIVNTATHIKDYAESLLKQFEEES